MVPRHFRQFVADEQHAEQRRVISPTPKTPLFVNILCVENRVKAVFSVGQRFRILFGHPRTVATVCGKWHGMFVFFDSLADSPVLGVTGW